MLTRPGSNVEPRRAGNGRDHDGARDRRQEKIQAVAGEFAIETGNGRTGGVCVRIVIPLPARPSTSAVADVRMS
jgi:hypothetical protein